MKLISNWNSDQELSFYFLLVLEKERERFVNFYAFYCTIATSLSDYRAFRDAFVPGIRWIYTTFAERQV